MDGPRGRDGPKKIPEFGMFFSDGKKSYDDVFTTLR